MWPPLSATVRYSSPMPTIEIGGVEIPDSALAWKFVRATGPGGQNVNKVSTAVECRLNLAQAGLEDALRQRLEELAANRLTSSGELRLFADRHRTQGRNRAEALQRLGALIEAAKQVPKPRVPTRPPPAQLAKRREEKRRRSEVKKQRQPPDVP